MALTGEAALAAGLIQHPESIKVRAATVDLTVGKIIVRGEESTAPKRVGPQEMFILVSAETVTVQPGLCWACCA